MLTLCFRKPMHGGKLTDDMPDSWSIGSFTCRALPADKQPNEGLIANFAKGLVDQAGAPISEDTLRQYDLEAGLREALQVAWA